MMVFGTLSGKYSCSKGKGQMPWEAAPWGRHCTVMIRERSAIMYGEIQSVVCVNGGRWTYLLPA